MSAPFVFTFEEWVKWVFDHPVTKPEWYWSDESEWWVWLDEHPEQVVDFMTLLFGNPRSYLRKYSDAQLNQGLWLLADPSCSNHMFALLKESVSWEARRQCLRSFYTLFANLFAIRCPSYLLHLAAHKTEPPSPLNLICYMWWDLVPLHGVHKAIDQECMAVIRKILLTISNEACIESALHGLGHWHVYCPDEVEQIIEEFLCTQPNISPELFAYAQEAQKGCVL